MKNKNQDEEIDIDVTVATEYIMQTYSTSGETEEKEFRTTQELVHEVSEMAELTLKDMNKILSDIGYENTFIDGIATWVMFLRN